MLDHRTRWLGVLVVAFVGLAFAPAAHAQTEVKSFTVNFVQQTVVPGTTDFLDVTVRNTSTGTKHSLGSANLYSPTALKVLSGAQFLEGKGTARPTEAGLELRNLALKPSQHVRVKVPISVHTAACGDFDWWARAVHADDFNAASGELAFDTNGSRLGTNTSGACELKFVQQPARTRIEQPIRGEDFTPTSNKLVAVQILDGNGGRTLAGKVSGVKMDYERHFLANGLLKGTLERPVGSDGIAYFDDLRIDAPGKYHLVAETKGVVAQSPSSSFEVESDATFCHSGQPCEADAELVVSPADDTDLLPSTQTRTSSTSTPLLTSPGLMKLHVAAQSGTSSGYLTVSVYNYIIHDCADYLEPAISDGRINGPERQKIVTLNYAGSLTGGRIAELLEVCFAAPYDFFSEGVLTPVDTDGDGQQESDSGRLPDCLRVVTDIVTGLRGPCVLSRRNEADGSKTLVIDVPANPKDPMYR